MNIGGIKNTLQKQFPFLLAAPALLWQSYFLYAPLAAFILYGLFGYHTSTGRFFFTFAHYRALIDPLYFSVVANSLWLALTTVCLCLLIGYPLAHFLALRAGRFRTPLLILLIVPSWTSFIVQVYAWFFLLKKEGILWNMMHFLGLVETHAHLLYTQFAAGIGMVYCYLPFMILPLFTVLERIDTTLIEASADLGATRFETLKRVVFPLSLPGIAAGALLVFVPAFGEFVIPDLLGGGKRIFLGNSIVDKFLHFRDWQSGSALVSMSILLPVISILLTIRIVLWLRTRTTKVRRQNRSMHHSATV